MRNVMDIAVTAVICGQALFLGTPGLLVYAAVMGVAMAVFARFYEEPTLAGRYGAQYEEYRRVVAAAAPAVTAIRLAGWRP